MPKFTLLTSISVALSLLSSPLFAAEKRDDKTWLKLSILSQNVGFQIHMLGEDSGAPDPKNFQPSISAIDKLLDQLVADGKLKKETIELQPELDIQESLINAVTKLVHKHASTYGIYTIREMMDIGARLRLRKFDEKAPVVLHVRMPKDMLDELHAILDANKLKK